MNAIDVPKYRDRKYRSGEFAPIIENDYFDYRLK